MSSNVIVLTAQHQYWGERPLKDIIKLYFRGKIEIIKSEEGIYIQSGISRNGITFKMPVPLVVRLLNFFGYKYKNNKIVYSNYAVYTRDSHICQYYHFDEKGRKFKYKCSKDEETIDHVTPISKGGKTTFENCVTCCRWHNEVVKKNHTPEEAGLYLIKKPYTPLYKKGDWVVLSFSYNPNSKAHRAFFKYMGIEFNHIA